MQLKKRVLIFECIDCQDKNVPTGEKNLEQLLKNILTKDLKATIEEILNNQLDGIKLEIRDIKKNLSGKLNTPKNQSDGHSGNRSISPGLKPTRPPVSEQRQSDVAENAPQAKINRSTLARALREAQTAPITSEITTSKGGTNGESAQWIDTCDKAKKEKERNIWNTD